MSRRHALLALLIALPLAGERAAAPKLRITARQPDRVGRPALGLVFDPAAGGLRPIRGIGLSARIGAPMPLLGPITVAAVSPLGDFALIVDAETGRVLLSRNLLNSIETRPLNSAIERPSRIVLSPAATSALLHDDDTGRLQVITGLPDAPRPGRAIALAGRPTALAVSDDGAAVLAAFAEGEAGALLLAVGGPLRLTLPAAYVSAMTFLRGRPDAVLADQRGNQIFLIQDLPGRANILTLAGEHDGIAAPVAVAGAGGNHHVFVANAGTGSIASVSLEDGSVRLYPCQCRPTALHRLQGNAVFGLTDPTPGPFLVFDGDAPEPRVFFVPLEPAQ